MDIWLAIFIVGIFLSPFILPLMLWIVVTTVNFMKDAISDVIYNIKGRLDNQRCMRRQRRLERLRDAEKARLAMQGDRSALELITNRDELEQMLGQMGVIDKYGVKRQ